MKISTRLFSAAMLMLVSVTMIVFVSYAWVTMSTAPEISGIKVMINGDNTISIAENIALELEDGTIANYPGFFKKTAALEPADKTLLSPVSTADGINWFVPTLTDGRTVVDSLEDFVPETDYSHANIEDGGYAYIDFWVVSPLSGTLLRICSGDSMDVESPSIGSYVVQLPESVKNFTNPTGYNLDDSYENLEASLRVGFLVNDERVTSDAVMNAYVDSAIYNENFRSLNGVYESGSETSFLIYEPNALVHPNKGASNVLTSRGIETYVCKDGEYWATYPIGYNSRGEIDIVTAQHNLVVQGETPWKYNNGSLMIDDMYQGYLNAQTAAGKSISLEDFYNNYMQGSYLSYVDYNEDGLFFKNSWDLLNYGDTRVTDEETLTILERTNAIQESYIVALEKNVPQRIRMFVWIEGQDVDCSGDAAGQNVAIRLELSGSTGY